jgi:hypothetical protein
MVTTWHWVAAHFVGILTFVTAVGGFFLTFRRVKAVHILVNSNLAKVMKHLGIEQERTEQLSDTLKKAGIVVPDKPKPEP